MQLTISATANIPAKLELSGIAVTGKAIADLVVKVLYADSTDFETLTTTTDVTLDEASGGWYRIIINSAKVDLAGMLLVQISSATLAFDTKEYLHEIVAASPAALIGTPIALDGGTATIAGMLTKMADDNAGGTFDATNDSLNKLAKDGTVSKPATAQTITANQAVNVAQWGGSNIATPAISGEPVVTLDATQAAYAPAKAGNKMDLIDAPNGTAVTAIQNGLSKPGTAQTITAADTANAATAQATIAKLETMIESV